VGRYGVSVEEIQLNDPQTLYLRWEDSQWSPFTIDLSTDQRVEDHLDTPSPSDRRLPATGVQPSLNGAIGTPWSRSRIPSS
jgi:hypothetical protein